MPLDYGQAFRPYGKAVKWSHQLPNNAAMDPGSALAVAELVKQSTLATPNLNIHNWTLEPIAVSASQPLVPVDWHGVSTTETELQAVLRLGVPIPDGFTPTNDGDASASFWQYDYVHSTGLKGRLYELYGLQNTNGAWSASFGTRLYGINDTPGCRQYSAQSYKDYATNPDSLFARPSWGVQGSGIPYAPGVLTKADCDRGYVDHMLLLETVNAKAGGFVWPALKDDGNIHDSMFPVKEGQCYRFAPSYQINSSWPYLLQLIVQAVRDHGCIITDRSSCLAFRAAPSASSYLGTLASWQILNSFPWGDLQLLAVGTDTNPVPTV